MKVKIIYCEIMSDHPLAMPQPAHSEIVEATGFNDPKLIKYITSKKDSYGHPYRKKKSLGYDYISGAGAVKLEVYTSPKIKKL